MGRYTVNVKNTSNRFLSLKPRLLKAPVLAINSMGISQKTYMPAVVSPPLWQANENHSVKIRA